MKRKVVSSLLIICIFLFTFSACNVPDSTNLDIPKASLSGSVLTWGEIVGAVGYEIDTGAGIIALDADCREYTLVGAGSIRIRAVGDGVTFTNSAWSEIFNYTPEDAHVHTDGNTDGYCDTCLSEIIITIDLYSINDLHGKFCDNGSQVGVDELATYLKDARENDEYSIFLSAGDMWQGSAESNLSGGFIVTEWMNELGFASMTIGNHEFDWGEDAIRSNLEVASFPFLAINIYDRETDERMDYCAPSAVVDLGPIQVGIIGAIGDCYSSISSDMVEDVYFKCGGELTELVKQESEKLRSEGVDFIVYSLHDGYSSSTGGVTDVSSNRISGYYQSSLFEYVDIVFEGHTHKSYILRDSKGTYHLQAGGENKGVSHAELEISLADGEYSVSTAEIVKSTDYAKFEDDPVTEELEDKYADIIDRAYSTLGYADKTYNSSALSYLIAQLYVEAGVEKWGDEYDIVLGGGYINTRSPYDLSSGVVRYSDVLSLFPFNNRLVLCSIRGSDLLSRFINNSSYYIHLSEYGESIRNSIKSNETYYVIVDTYTSLYTSNRLTEIEYYDDTTFARDLLGQAVADGRLGSRAESAYTVTDIKTLLEIAKSLSANEETEEYYCITGRIIDTPHSRYGNLTLEDSEKNQIYVYGLYDELGNRYEYMQNKPNTGDVITVYARLCYYVNPNDPSDAKIELKNAVLIEIE